MAFSKINKQAKQIKKNARPATLTYTAKCERLDPHHYQLGDKVKYTAIQYAEMVIRETYKVENIYNLTSAIGYSATKIGIWASNKADISTWAAIDEEHQARNDAEWKIADTKYRAYIIAFNTLSAKLPDFIK